MKWNFRRPAIVTTLLALTLFLQGCFSVVRNFKPADASGQRPGNIKLHLYSNSASGFQDAAFLNEATARAYPQLKDVLTQHCQVADTSAEQYKPAVAPIAAATLTVLAPAVGKLAFDLYMDKQARDVEKLKKSLQASYRAELTLDAQQLAQAVKQGACLVLERSRGDDMTPEFIGVLALRNALRSQQVGKRAGADPDGRRLQKYSSSNIQTTSASMAAFTATPVFVAVRSAVAKTENAANPTIAVSFVISARGIGRQDNGLPAFAQIGEAVDTVRDLPLGEPAPNHNTVTCQATACPAFSPIPLLSQDTGQQIVVITVAVTETGSASGVDLDIAKSELAAIKAAMGPVISGVIDKALKE